MKNGCTLVISALLCHSRTGFGNGVVLSTNDDAISLVNTSFICFDEVARSGVLRCSPSCLANMLSGRVSMGVGKTSPGRTLSVVM